MMQIPMFFLTIPEKGSIHENPELLHARGIRCTGAVMMEFTVNNEKVRRELIITDEVYKKLTPLGQEYMISHERGHIEDGLEKLVNWGIIKQLVYLFYNSVIGPSKIELAADANAVKAIGRDKCLKGMQECIETFKSLGMKSAAKQIKRRMRYV